MPGPSDTREHILESAYGLFYRGGFQRTSIHEVADAAGITKRTLYNHFPSKDALLAEVMFRQADLAAAELMRWAGDTPKSPEACVTAIFHELREWSKAPNWQGSGFTRAALELAWAPGHPARKAAAKQKELVEAAVTASLVRAGAQGAHGMARTILVLIEGAMVLRLIHGDGNWIDVAEKAARSLLSNN